MPALALLELPHGVTTADLAGGFGVAGPQPAAGRIEAELSAADRLGSGGDSAAAAVWAHQAAQGAGPVPGVVPLLRSLFALAGASAVRRLLLREKPDGTLTFVAQWRSLIVEGRLLGLIAAGSTLKQLLPADNEARVALFAELVTTAIANADSRQADWLPRADRRRCR